MGLKDGPSVWINIDDGELPPALEFRWAHLIGTIMTNGSS